MDLTEALKFSYKQLLDCLGKISEEKSNHKYQPEKWSIKTLVLHISDTEKVFQYRALSIARGVRENLISFDENEFADHSNADHISFKKIVDEFMASATSMHLLFENLRKESYLTEGMANNQKLTPALIGFLTAGHRLHHLHILKERYLV